MPSNEERTREAFALWNARDFDELLAGYFEPEAVWDVTPIGVPGMEAYRGHEGIRKFFRDWLDVFPDSAIDVDAVETRGEWSIATVIQRVSGGTSGAPVPFRYFGIGHWIDGRLRFVENHVDEAEARHAFAAYVKRQEGNRVPG
jgi:ketosteroid isomerase-like protein